MCAGGAPEEAEELNKRALEIREAKLGADNVGLAIVLNEMGTCAHRAGRAREAERLFKRSLEIQGRDGVGVAARSTVWVSACVRWGGRGMWSRCLGERWSSRRLS